MEDMQEKPKRTRRKKIEQVEQETATVQDAEASLQGIESVEQKQEKPAEASVSRSKAKEAPKPTAYTVKVNASLLNVRERPELTARIIGVAKHNENLTVIDELDDGWGKLENGTYVLLKFTERDDQ